jgi:hypothetical protein
MRAMEASGLPLTVGHRAVFWRGCREVVVASKAVPAASGHANP